MPPDFIFEPIHISYDYSFFESPSHLPSFRDNAFGWYNNPMAIVYMLGWWYGRGWGWLLQTIQYNLAGIQEIFSVSILLKTWFSPWKQIRTPSSLHQFFQAAIDNTVSRFIGGIIRTFVLLAATIAMLTVLSIGLAMFVLWPLLPLMIVILPIIAVVV